jgi:hypothetical protein
VRSEAWSVAGWIAAVTVAGWASSLVVVHGTPIDHALPLLAVLVVVLAAVSHPAVQVAVPLLLAAEIALPDEATRLLAFGVVLAVAWSAAVLAPDPEGVTYGSRGSALLADPRKGASPPRPTPEGSQPRSDARNDSATLSGSYIHGAPDVRGSAKGADPRLLYVTPSGSRSKAVLLALSAIITLRWIPLTAVLWPRELLLLALAALLVIALRGTPFGIAVAVLIALLTPAVPLRTLALPLVVLIVAAFLRPKVKLTIPSVAAVAVALTFFAWSGIAARAFPYLLKTPRTVGERHLVNAALAPNRSVTVDVPDGATALIVSGANVPRLRRGYVLGILEPGATPIRIGDAADWGALRRETFYAARNPLPRDPAGRVRGYGYSAWLDGGGRVALPHGARTIRVTADAHLPADAFLQVEAFELAPR